MKAVILAGGIGTRLSEETVSKPKPMVEIGGRPILWHIMKIYAAHGVNEFIICLGYKGYMIKEYFANYLRHSADMTIDLSTSDIEIHRAQVEPWRVTLVETGETTHTGGRLKRVQSYLGDEDFCFTYGDGLGDVDISATIEFHKSHGKLATVTAVRMPGRFGGLEMDGDSVTQFVEKPLGDGNWINGGFFVLSPKAVDFVDGDDVPWERGPMERITNEGQLMAYKHEGFWRPMDTLRDKDLLESMWANGEALWKTWE